MMKKPLLILLLLLSIGAMLISQERYEVHKTSFSSSKYDEFCPVIFQNQVIFCSNLEDELLITYQNGKNKGLYNMFMVGTGTDAEGSEPEVFSRNLITPYNDGPASFSPDGKTVVYSRNQDVNTKAKNIFDLSNNLGLYFAEFKDGEWTPSMEFPYNDPKYSNTTPCFGADGIFLYFGSDMPGGLGGADLYRSKLTDGVWGEPTNLGEVINTSGNEVYPFIAENGDLFFASDGHSGLGKKDIFLSRMSGQEWIPPIHLEAPINSNEDDFGLVTDWEFSNGYFSSSRDKTDDIYGFSTLIPQLFDCDTLKKNNYCFEFWDEQYPGIDSMPVVYEWVFSDGTKKRGLSVQHCLPGPGKHWAKLNIVDNTTSNTFFTQTSMDFELTDHVQAFIDSRGAGIVDNAMQFDGIRSNITDFTIEEYWWDFGDNSFDTGSNVEHAYQKAGSYTVRLGVKGSIEDDPNSEIRCVKKPISVFKDNQSLAMFLSGIQAPTIAEIDSSESDTEQIQNEFSVFEVNPEEEVFRVEVLASDDKLLIEDELFDPLRDQYDIKEFYLSTDSMYSYTVGEFSSLLNSFDVYQDVVQKGFSTANVKTYVLAELPTEVIAKINRDFAHFADANFEFNESNVSKNSYPILNRIAEIMEENPDLVLEIAAHTDNVGSFEFNLELSEKRAASIVNYLTSKGIENFRLVGKGYGESRPVATNSTEEGRMQNRRVEFIILNQ